MIVTSLLSACATVGSERVTSVRKLNYASATISRLAEARAAVGPEISVMIDAGFWRGSEIVIAMAPGSVECCEGRLMPMDWQKGGKQEWKKL